MIVVAAFAVIMTVFTKVEAAPEIEMVFVKGGCFQMGDTFGDGEEVHEVCVDDFYMGKYEVTQAQWQAVMGNNPSEFKSCGPNCPEDSVSWNDAQAFIKKLSEMAGKKYRLPTEAEWEYAARSGGKKEKWAGTSDVAKLGDYAWFNINSGDETHPVGQKKANGFGLYDMTGNVWEWVQDIYSHDYYKVGPKNNPKGPSTGDYQRAAHLENGRLLIDESPTFDNRVFRGGCFHYSDEYIRASYRSSFGPDYRFISNGFRVALSAVQ